MADENIWIKELYINLNLHLLTHRSSHQRCSVKKVFLKISHISRETLMVESLLNKDGGLQTCNSIKNGLKHRCFFVKFVRFLRTPILNNICEGLFLDLDVKFPAWVSCKLILEHKLNFPTEHFIWHCCPFYFWRVVKEFRSCFIVFHRHKILNTLLQPSEAATAGVLWEKAQACNFIKIETLAQLFSCESCEISKNTFSYRTPVGDCFCTFLFWTIIWGVKQVTKFAFGSNEPNKILKKCSKFLWNFENSSWSYAIKIQGGGTIWVKINLQLCLGQ